MERVPSVAAVLITLPEVRTLGPSAAAGRGRLARGCRFRRGALGRHDCSWTLALALRRDREVRLDLLGPARHRRQRGRPPSDAARRVEGSDPPRQPPLQRAVCKSDPPADHPQVALREPPPGPERGAQEDLVACLRERVALADRATARWAAGRGTGAHAPARPPTRASLHRKAAILAKAPAGPRVKHGTQHREANSMSTDANLPNCQNVLA